LCALSPPLAHFFHLHVRMHANLVALARSGCCWGGGHPASGPGVNATYACPRETCAATLTNQALALWDTGAQAQTAQLDAAIRQQQALDAPVRRGVRV
jgi:hypothetical protein